MFTGNFFIRAEDEFLEGLLEAVIEGDVDEGVDHGVGVGEHVEPELVLLQHTRQLEENTILFHLLLKVVLSGW